MTNNPVERINKMFGIDNPFRGLHFGKTNPNPTKATKVPAGKKKRINRKKNKEARKARRKNRG